MLLLKLFRVAISTALKSVNLSVFPVFTFIHVCIRSKIKHWYREPIPISRWPFVCWGYINRWGGRVLTIIHGVKLIIKHLYHKASSESVKATQTFKSVKEVISNSISHCQASVSSFKGIESTMKIQIFTVAMGFPQQRCNIFAANHRYLCP